MTNLIPQDESVCTGERTANRFRGIGLLLGGLSLVALSAAVNIRHAIGPMMSTIDVAEAGAFALATTIGFVVLPTYGLRMARDGSRGLAVAAFVGALLCGSVSFTNLVGSAMKHRLTAAVEATDENGKRKAAQKAIEAAEVELAALGTGRPSATVQADIDAKLTSRNDLEGCEAKWLPSSKARSICIEVNQLRAEKATATRREDLQGTITNAQATLATGDASKLVGSADTASIVLAGKKLGLALDPETVDLAKGVGTAFSVELFAALMLAGWERSRAKFARPTTKAGLPLGVVGSEAASNALPASGTITVLGHSTVVDGSHQVSNATASEAAEGPGIAEPDTVSKSVQSLTVPTDPAERLLELLSDRGGEVFGGHRSFARALGISHGHVTNVLSALEGAGRIGIQSTKRGTRVWLAA